MFAAESFCFFGGVDFVDLYGGGKNIQNIMEHQSFKGQKEPISLCFLHQDRSCKMLTDMHL